jgi:hypothetical protein
MFANIVFDPPFPAAWILALGGTVAVLTILNYFRARREAGTCARTMLTVLRLAVVAGMTVLLLRPMILAPSATPTGQPVFTVLVDLSGSMATTDLDGETRHAVVKRRLEEAERTLFQQLRGDYDLRFCRFSDTLGRVPFDMLLLGDPDGSPSTDIATALMNGSVTTPGVQNAGILLISDGRDNGGNDPLASAAYLRSAGTPVWTTTVGTTDETKDLVVAARFDQNFLFRDQESKLKVDLHQHGFEGWYAKVELLREGEPGGTQQCMLRAGMEQVTFPIREASRGTYRYTVRVEPLAGEADPKNNERTVFVQVVDERAKVLLVEASPYWESKFLLRALQADPNLEVDAIFHMSERRDKLIYVTQALPEGAQANTTGSADLRVPRTSEELFKYDCIVLGQHVERVFEPSQLLLLKEYVETRGGNLIFARGKAYEEASSPLASLEPVIWEDGTLNHARFALTSAGTANPMFNFGASQPADVVLRELPDMISITRVKEEKSLAVVLAKGVDANNAEIATIAYQRYGKGKVMSIGAEGLWQWAFMKEELSKYDAVYARFWGQMIRWLVYDSDFLPGQDIAFRTDQFSYSTGDAVTLVVQSKETREGFAPQIEITAPGGATSRLAPAEATPGDGYFSAIYYPEEEGAFRAVLLDNGHGQGEQTVEFSVYSTDLESSFVGANPGLMAQIAAASGGSVLDFDAWDTLPEKLKAFELSMKEEARPEDAWDTMGNFLLLVGILGLEWFTRRRVGLL